MGVFFCIGSGPPDDGGICHAVHEQYGRQDHTGFDGNGQVHQDSEEEGHHHYEDVPLRASYNFV